MAEDTMKLVIIRHGESEWNLKNLFTGWSDVDLTDTGRAEAAAGGEGGEGKRRHRPHHRGGRRRNKGDEGSGSAPKSE